MCINTLISLPPCSAIFSHHYFHQAKEAMEEFKSIVKDQKQIRWKRYRSSGLLCLKSISRLNVLVITRCVWSALTTLDYSWCFCDIFTSFHFIWSFISMDHNMLLLSTWEVLFSSCSMLIAISFVNCTELNYVRVPVWINIRQHLFLGCGVSFEDKALQFALSGGMVGLFCFVLVFPPLNSR